MDLRYQSTTSSSSSTSLDLNLASRLERAEAEIERCKRMLANQRRLLEIQTTTQIIKIEDDDDEEEVIDNSARSATNNNNEAAATIIATKAEEEEIEALDTIDIAQRVLALLTSRRRNGVIGLATFAKLVLGMSRQTANRLLYSPKPWHQLSTRVREHYRKMHAWLRATEAPQRQQGRANAATSSATSSSSFVSSNGKSRQQSTTAVAVNEPERRQPFIDTAKLVRKVKEMLRAFDISQGLFASYIVGLTLSSVSHMFAYPKPWSKLMPRGREPYIRMQEFVNEPLDALKKLMDQRQMNKLTSAPLLDHHEERE